MLYVKSINGKRIKDAEARTEISALQTLLQTMDADGYVGTPHLANGAVTEVKVNSDFLKAIKNAYVTPEMFGAVGDGVTDDTNAWQDAVNVGVSVIATKNKYKCSQINVSKNISIDCNNAEFVCSSEYLFRLNGSVKETLTNENNYIANQNDYKISETEYANYSGYGVIKGSNNWMPLRDYYRAGMVGYFRDGYFIDKIPVDVTLEELLLVKPITCKIKNISDVTFTSTTDGKIIYCQYGAFCKFENISMTNECYHVVALEFCYSCILENLNINLPMYTGEMPYTYPVEFHSTCFCSVRDSFIYNPFWHAWTTGGYYIALNNTIENCEMFSDNIDAILDHPNSIGTRVINTVSSGVGLAQGGYAENVTVVSRKSQNKDCLLTLFGSTIKELAEYTVENVKFKPDSRISLTTYGVILRTYAQTENNTVYYNDVKLKNVLNEVASAVAQQILGFWQRDTDGIDHIIINNMDIDNVNMRLRLSAGQATTYDFSSAKFTVRNCKTPIIATDATYKNIVIDAPEEGDLNIIDSYIYWLTGGKPDNLVLSNVEFPESLNQAFKADNLIRANNLCLKGRISNYSDITKALMTNVTMQDTLFYSVIWRTDPTSPVFAQKVNGVDTPTTVTLASV